MGEARRREELGLPPRQKRIVKCESNNLNRILNKYPYFPYILGISLLLVLIFDLIFLNLSKLSNSECETGSDCEIILFLYKEFGIEQTVKMLDGVFMFVLYDEINDILYAGRDPIGVRPGFISLNGDEVFISSEAKSLIKIAKNIVPFPPGSWWSSKDNKKFNKYFYCKPDGETDDSHIDILQNIKI